MAKRMVSTSLDDALYNDWKLSRHKLNFVIRRGMMALKEEPGFIARIRDLEDTAVKLHRENIVLRNRLNTVERVV